MKHHVLVTVIQSGQPQTGTEGGLYLLLFPPEGMILPLEGRATYGTHFLLWITTLL